jgi:hypothetical protein
MQVRIVRETKQDVIERKVGLGIFKEVGRPAELEFTALVFPVDI